MKRYTASVNRYARVRYRSAEQNRARLSHQPIHSKQNDGRSLHLDGQHAAPTTEPTHHIVVVDVIDSHSSKTANIILTGFMIKQRWTSLRLQAKYSRLFNLGERSCFNQHNAVQWIWILFRLQTIDWLINRLLIILVRKIDARKIRGQRGCCQ